MTGNERAIIVLAVVAMLATLAFRGKTGWQYHGKPGLKDTETQTAKTDAKPVEDSGEHDNPIVTANFANTRFISSLPTMPVPLRQVTRGPFVESQVLNG